MALLQELVSRLAANVSLYEFVLVGFVSTNIVAIVVGWIVNRHYKKLRQQLASLETQMHDRWD